MYDSNVLFHQIINQLKERAIFSKLLVFSLSVLKNDREKNSVCWVIIISAGVKEFQLIGKSNQSLAEVEWKDRNGHDSNS